jgi:hypothetical protein
MNLVLHPTSADRYTPANAPSKAKRRATTSSVAPSGQPSEAQSPVPPTPSTSQYPSVRSASLCSDAAKTKCVCRVLQQQAGSITPYMAPTSPTYSQQGYPFPAEAAPVHDPSTYQTYGPQEAAASWTYPSQGVMDRAAQSYGPPALPSIHTAMGRSNTTSSLGESGATDVVYSNASATSETWQVDSASRSNGENISYRSWTSDQQSFTPLDNQAVAHEQEVIDPALRAPQISSSASQQSTWPTTPADHYASRYVSVPSAPPAAPQQPPSHHAAAVETSIYASASYAQQQQEQQQQQQAQAQGQTTFQQGQNYVQENTPPSTIPPLPRHTYTRTLVGPLSANACRLLDEHRKPGIFFLFQDLSIRTEGASLCAILKTISLRAVARLSASTLSAVN